MAAGEICELREAGGLEMDVWERAQEILPYSLRHHKPLSLCSRTQEGTSYAQPIAAGSILLKHITGAARYSGQLTGQRQNLAQHLTISTTKLLLFETCFH